MKAVKLSFSEPVHFGQKRLSSTSYTFDAATLFSALYIEAMNMCEEKKLLSACLAGDFLLSDAFPFVGDELYLPKPVLPISSEEQARSIGKLDSRFRKAAKKLAYVPTSCFTEYLRGETNPLALLEQFNLGASFGQMRVNLTVNDDEDQKLYMVGGYRFNLGCGLYFYVDGTYDLNPILEQLAWSGIGGKRSSGYGRFSYEIIEGVKLPGGDCAKRMLLATSTPTNEELSDELLSDATYKLVSKGGFAYSGQGRPQKKKEAVLFSSGSVFEKEFQGEVMDVRAGHSHPVYRYAKAMWMGV